MNFYKIHKKMNFYKLKSNLLNNIFVEVSL